MKEKLENVNFCPSLLGKKFFVRFLGELKTKQKDLSKLTDTTLSNWKVNDKCTIIEIVKIPANFLSRGELVFIGKLYQKLSWNYLWNFCKIVPEIVLEFVTITN